MKHGYTNQTTLSGSSVTKSYAGPDAVDRQSTEAHVLRTLAGRIPVPLVLTSEPGTLTTSYVEGTHGQDLLDTSPALVLAACGRVLSRLHAVPVGEVFPGASGVVVHGDFGPNNVLLSSGEVVALLDWEWCRPGAAISDLAWCEWIVRTHHASCVPALDAFYSTYEHRPSLRDVKAAAAERCRELIAFVDRWDNTGKAGRLWRDRLAAVEAWN